MKSFVVLSCFALFFAIGCSKKSDNNLVQQPHDQNKMMKIMHDMEDSMHAMQMSDDPDIAFAQMMRSHHQGAVKMAQLEQSEGSDVTMKAMAQNIITSQNQEIQQLTTFLGTHSANNNDAMFTMKMMEMMEEMNNQADLQVINGKTDQDFASLMINHHQSAVMMAHHYLLTGTEGELIDMAHAMIESQQQEIKEFQNWLLPYIRK